MKRLMPLLLMTSTLAWGHDHMVRVDESNPEAARYKLCDRMTDVAIQAVADRDKGLPMKTYEVDGTQGPTMANQIIQGVYEQAAISSPKRAAAYGRARCNELWQAAP